jgi:hypothetical protein
LCGNGTTKPIQYIEGCAKSMRYPQKRGGIGVLLRGEEGKNGEIEEAEKPIRVGRVE